MKLQYSYIYISGNATPSAVLSRWICPLPCNIQCQFYSGAEMNQKARPGIATYLYHST
jgi:hypothetical protein